MVPGGSRGKTPLGAHMSVAGGVSKGLERALGISIDAVQIFTKNNNRWFEAPLKAEEITRFPKEAVLGKSLLDAVGEYNWSTLTQELSSSMSRLENREIEFNQKTGKLTLLK